MNIQKIYQEDLLVSLPTMEDMLVSFPELLNFIKNLPVSYKNTSNSQIYNIKDINELISIYEQEIGSGYKPTLSLYTEVNFTDIDYCELNSDINTNNEEDIISISELNDIFLDGTDEIFNEQIEICEYELDISLVPNMITLHCEFYSTHFNKNIHLSLPYKLASLFHQFQECTGLEQIAELQ